MATQELLEYITKQGLDKHIHPQAFSTYPKRFLHKILQQIDDAYVAWNPTSVNIKFSRVSKHDSTFPKGKDYRHSPKEIRDDIENLDKICCVTSFTVDGHKIDIHIVAPSKKKYTKDYFISCIQRIYMWLSICAKHAREKCSQSMCIYIYFTDLKKLLPKDPNEYLTETHVNTAFTTSCLPTTELYIFRHEEWFKVFIHETFHNMGLDFSELNQTSTQQAILDIFPVNSDVRLFETYCEIWAEVIHVLFVSYMIGKKNGEGENLEHVLNDAIPRIRNEQLFSVFQCAKVLYYFGMDYEDLYKKGIHYDIVREREYKEKTNVLSYYILKTILFYHGDDFITWCIQHNKNETLDFNKDPATLKSVLDSYCQLIKTRYRDYSFVKNIHFMLKKFSTMSESDLRSQQIQTLRMTMYDLDII
jgi:hypothetical protein